MDGVEERGGVPSRLIKTDRLLAGKEGTPMTNVRTLPVDEGTEEITLALDERAREGVRRMIAAALRAEADEYVERFSNEVDEVGHRLVVRNGRAQERKVTVGSGTIPIRAPRVNDKRVDEEAGERQRFSSRILPAYARRSPKVGEVIPIPYLRDLSTGDFRPALEQLLGEDARRAVADGRRGRDGLQAARHSPGALATVQRPPPRRRRARRREVQGRHPGHRQRQPPTTE